LEKEFILLINSHRGLLYKICNLYCKEAEDRKDLFQEIVLQLWKAFPGFRQASAVSTWMYRIGLNTAVSNFRKQKRKIFPAAFSDYELESPAPEQFSDSDENITALHLAIGTLNTIEKAVVMLYLEEKSYEEIAQILGITKTNVGVKLNRIKNKLEVLLKSDKYELR
jgi:RNA polymerase sigma-70 factor (ECF subfamily)